MAIGHRARGSGGCRAAVPPLLVLLALLAAAALPGAAAKDQGPRPEGKGKRYIARMTEAPEAVAAAAGDASNVAVQ